MTTAFEVCSRFWSAPTLEPLKSRLEKLQILELPDDLIDFNKVDKDKTIVIIKKSSMYNSLQILHRGFSHCLQAERSDLKKELLISCLMLIRPEALVENEVPFFFKGFSKDIDWKNTNNTLFLQGRTTKDRGHILDLLKLFLTQNTRLTSIAELAMQIADELYTNALYYAPTKNTISSADRSIDFFAAYDKDQLFLGCIDSHGSFDREQLTSHLLKSYASNQVQPELGPGGAGLGLKMVIDNSANFYVYCEKNRRTVISCGLRLKGIKVNLVEAKHLHICFP
jgi:hypothetical protein